MTNVKHLNNIELVAKLTFLVAEEKKNIVAQIVLLKEVRKRKLALELGYPSLVEFCVDKLGISRDQAWKRSQAAGVVEKEPVFLDLLKKGKTSVSSLAVLAPKLTEQTSEELRDFVPGKSKREVEAFVSNLNRDGSRSEKKQTIRLVLELAPEELEKLERARKILKANKAELSYEEILASAVDLLLDKKDPARKAERAKERSAPKRKETKTPVAANNGRYIPAKVKHQIYRSTGQTCSYVSPAGKRCQEKHGLAIDHIRMFCKGGEHSVSNLRLMCPAHNRYLAERELGFTYKDIKRSS